MDGHVGAPLAISAGRDFDLFDQLRQQRAAGSAQIVVTVGEFVQLRDTGSVVFDHCRVDCRSDVGLVGQFGVQLGAFRGKGFGAFAEARDGQALSDSINDTGFFLIELGQAALYRGACGYGLTAPIRVELAPFVEIGGDDIRVQQIGL